MNECSSVYTYCACLVCVDELAVPWPMRLVEWEGGDGGGHGVVVVELVMAGGVDSEMKCSQCYHTNHSAILRWQRGSQHAKLDLRLAIRRELKKVSLSVTPFVCTIYTLRCVICIVIGYVCPL